MSWHVIRNRSIYGVYTIEFRLNLIPRLHMLLEQSTKGVRISVHEDIKRHYCEYTERSKAVMKEIIELLRKNQIN